jgi:peptide/nickel transport system ATP-binding protein
MADPVLDVVDLQVGFRTPAGLRRAVRGVGFSLQPGEILGLVGESGSGKSTLVLGMLRLLPPPGVIVGGSVRLGGRDLLALDEESLRQLRWSGASLVPQSAMQALNPVLTVGAQVVDTLQSHRPQSRAAAERRATELLALVGIDPVHLHSYPHQLSGGMRQRVALGLALALDPPLVVMDEPTTALDVVVEREILQRILALQAERGFAMIFVTHDLSLLMEFATRIGVLYAGRLVELAPVDAFRAGGRHPYTRGLLGAIAPAIDEDRVPVSIPGAPPSLARPPTGCPFHPRCGRAAARCAQEEPPLRSLGDAHEAACLFP